MKSTGMTRELDKLGRIVLPKELRNTLGIENKTPLAVFVQEDAIVLQKYQPNSACMITGEISEHNFSLANGNITLSSEGAKTLLKALQQYLTR
ncbi:AbrB family transcriptional regulator [Bacillus sp. AFS098217]|uniref:AbrB/MazE/SpoVT family DNA-binding domain-containing protein n=1 Tax=Bacillus sp. AFS098217 TaxID=2033868 RepID=UPI000BEC0879|nr:AbrB/MazE/SpoVT family DNA-binding domain-containing protein [Bacillus sp. AFS098217]PEB54587.1 AbrB family transcriptional regulator [Bacillus sp. AFS098217]